MSQLPVRQIALNERGLIESAARIATDTARWGLRAAVAPTLPLPTPLRRALFDSIRLAVETAAVVPQAMLYALQGLTSEMDDLEERNARREDLGRRLRREARRDGRTAPEEGE